MGFNKHSKVQSFEEMAEEQAQETVAEPIVAAEPVAETTEPTEVGDKSCDCTDCIDGDCTETPKAE